jgi:hypothetical protein
MAAMAAAMEAGVAVPEAAEATAEVTAPILALHISCICHHHHKLFIWKQLASRYHVSR